MKIRFSLLLCLAFVPGVVYALGLGNIQLESALNEPLQARIELLSASANDLNSLNIGLADEAAFRRAGIPRESVLIQLHFSIKESDAGPDYILVSSDDPIREPYLDFLVEVNWSQGRLYREYTVLLDPPIYVADEMRRKVTAPSITTAQETVPGIRDEEPVVYYPSETTAPVKYMGGDYGPVVNGETLWSISRATRPDSSVSIQQMMLALLRANPEAFINGNINGLKRGYVLKAPDLSEARSLDKVEAFAQAQLQNNLWEEARQAAALAPPVRPEGAPTQPQPVVSEPVVSGEKPTEEIKETKPAVVEGQSELRLVAPVEAGKSASQGGAVDPGKEALTKELALASETLEALTQENMELKDKITESDVIMGDLKRLITLKETELAALQQQVAKRAAQQAAPEQPAPVTQIAEKSPAPESTKSQQSATPEQLPASPKPVKKKEPSIVTAVMNVAADLAVQLRNYWLYIVGALGVVVLVFAGAYIVRRGVDFVQRWRSAAEHIQPGTFVNMGEGPIISDESEDSTDMNLAGEGPSDQEAITIQPGPGSPSFEKTQVVGRPSAAETPKEEVSNVAEDPLEEVNVFLAYEHFDQAEEFVKNALEKEPDNLAFHVKLLEVYYTANNRKAYEQAAHVLYDKVQGKGDYWGMALAMWQVLSPNRALFAAPVAGEETAEVPAAKEAGGIVNITGEGEAAFSGFDFDLDTTGGGAGTGDTLEVEAPSEPDVLDVTAAIGTADTEILDFTAAVDTEDTGAVELEASATTADDQGLDFSLELEGKPAEEEQPLEFSLDLLQEEGEIPAKPAEGDNQALEYSLVMESKHDEEHQPLEIGLDLLQEEGKTPAGATADDNALDFSLDLEGHEDEDMTAIPHGPGAEPEVEVPQGGSDLLDITSAIDIGEDAMDVSRTSSSLLDVTSALSLEDQEPQSSRKFTGDTGEDLMDVSKPGGPDRGADLLDVTSAQDFALESGKDLLDVTFSGSVPTKEKDEDDSALDFELAPDQPVPGDDSIIAFDGIDITAATSTPVPGLALESESSPESEEDIFALDMDATMQIPNKQSSPSAGEAADTTVVVPRSSGGTQSDDDEIATQMDLAKAYIELGNAESAKTILDEIIAIGNDVQRRQARDLLGQIV